MSRVVGIVLHCAIYSDLDSFQPQCRILNLLSTVWQDGSNIQRNKKPRTLIRNTMEDCKGWLAIHLVIVSAITDLI